MRRRNSRNVFDEDRETRKMLYISGSVLAIAVLAFVITFIVYSNTFNNDELQVGETQSSDNTNSTTSASTQIGKSVNQVESQNDVTNTVTNSITQKVAINTTNMQKENTTTNTTTNTNVSNKANTTNTVTSTSSNTTNTIKTNTVENTTKNTTKKELKFVKPVEGEIVKEFAKDKLVYSETLKEWVIHNGIDIKAEKTAIVKSAEDGTVKSIKNDPRYGISVVVEHQDGYKTVYSNLLTAEFIKEGEKVTQGQTLGTVGNTATFEIADDPHLHFEIIKGDEYLNPEQYIK